MLNVLITTYINPLRLLLIIICCLIINTITAQNINYSNFRKIDYSSFKENRKFYYYNDSLIINFNIKADIGNYQLTEILLNIESNDADTRTFIIDWDSNDNKLSVFSLYKSKINRHVFSKTINLHQQAVNMLVILDFSKNRVSAYVNEHSIFFNNMELNSQDGYRFNLFPLWEDNKLYVSDVNIYTSAVRDSRKTWLWFLVIIIIDIIIFIWIKYRRKTKKKKLLQKRKEDADLRFNDSEKSFYIDLPKQSAICIVGNLEVKDKRGNEITKQFSPLLKELLALIILYSARNGITSEQLKEILWSKKSISSARNNRSVYFNKLRKIFEEVGNIELIDENGHWKLQSNDVFIDYLEYQKLLTKDLNTDDVLKLVNIVKNGTVLQDSNFDWLHTFQSEFSDSAIRNILKVAQDNDFRNEQRMGIYLADIIFNLDRLNEHALYIKCKSYIAMGQHSSARVAFDNFVEEYIKVYGIDFPLEFSEFIERKDIVFDSNGIPFFE